MITGRLNMRLARPIVGARPRRNWVAPAVPTPAKIGKKMANASAGRANRVLDGLSFVATASRSLPDVSAASSPDCVTLIGSISQPVEATSRSM